MHFPEPFETASAVREANRLLLEKLHGFEDDDYPAEFLDEIETFQQRAAATGAYLSSLDDRSEAQSLVNFWLTILFNGGRRPETVILAKFNLEAARARAGASPPYKGLEAFQIEDCGSFFGRSGTVREMLDRLSTNRVLAVTGLSGSGKSSVVRAGLIPRLREGELPNSREWAVLDPIVPGRDPVAALSELAAQVGGGEGRLTDAKGFVAALDRVGRPVLVSVDQFEELFTLCADEEDRRLVLDALAAAATSGAYRHVVIITMRSEFDSHVETHAEFAALFREGRVQIGALSAQELHKAIEEPAMQVGVSFEPGLPEELVQRVLGEPAGLPLLQFTLLELWKRRTADNKLSWKPYSDLGGSPREILAGRATDVYKSFETNQDRTFSHRIFLALAEIGSGLEPTARRVTRAELDRIGTRDNVDHVLRVWEENGLIRIAPRGPIAPESHVEVAHEALIRNWDLLVGWIEDHFATTRRRRLLTERARAWKEGKDTLLGELSLREAELYGDLTPEEQHYVTVSHAAIAVAEAERKAAIAAEDSALRRRKRWALAAAAAGVLLLGGGLTATGYAVVASQEAYDARQDASETALRARKQQESQRFRFSVFLDRQRAAARQALAVAQRATAAATARLADAQRQERAARSAETAARANEASARARLRTLEEHSRLARANVAVIEAQAQARLDDVSERLAEAQRIISQATRMAAEQRPAISLDQFEAGNVPYVWRQLLEEPLRGRVAAAARSVGLLTSRIDDRIIVSTAFMIGDGVAAALLPRQGEFDGESWTIDFGDRPGESSQLLFDIESVEGEIRLEDADVRLVLLRVAPRSRSRNAELPPPLPLAEVLFNARTEDGWGSGLRRPGDPFAAAFRPEPLTRLFLVGFPQFVSQPVITEMFGGEWVKRVQPGFLMNDRRLDQGTREISYDVTSFGGNMGSPVIDLESGAVVGIHWGGGGPSADSFVSEKNAVAFDAALLLADPLRRLLPVRPAEPARERPSRRERERRNRRERERERPLPDAADRPARGEDDGPPPE